MNISSPIPHQLMQGNRYVMPFLPRYSFGVVSDLHVNSTSNGAPEDIERMFKKFENRHISKVFCCGDITTNHTAAQLSAFTDIKDQHPGIGFYSCTGNHDIGLTGADWQTYVGHPFNHWFMWHNDAFIFMPIDVWEGSHPYQANLEWLEGLLQDLASTRVFLFIHFPLNSNSSSFQYPGLEIGQTYGFSSDSEDNATLIQMLKDHGNVIVFTGHSHYALETQDEQASGEQMVFFEEDGVSHVHVPSLSRPRDRSMEYIEDGHPELQPSQGLQVDVYDKFIKVRGIEFNLTVGDGRKGNDRLQNLYVGQNALSLWSNPYVTDGLVAMWDGEWNVGPGKHSSTASTWKDLIGSLNFAISSGNIESSWDDSGFIINNASNLATYNYSGLDSENATLEIVSQYSSSGNWNVMSFPVFSSTDAQPGFQIGFTTDSSYSRYYGGSTSFPNSKFRIQNMQATGKITISHVFSRSNYTTIYVNSENASATHITNYFASYPKQIRIPDSRYAANYSAIVYSIRLYNHALTTDEISANYKVDKQRFGL